MGRNGGAQRTVWEMLMEMERFKYRRFGSGGPGSGPGEGLRAGQSSCGGGLGDAFQLPKKDLASAIRAFRAPEVSAVRSRSRPSRPSCKGQSGVACFHVLCCRMH